MGASVSARSFGRRVLNGRGEGRGTRLGCWWEQAQPEESQNESGHRWWHSGAHMSSLRRSHTQTLSTARGRWEERRVRVPERGTWSAMRESAAGRGRSQAPSRRKSSDVTHPEKSQKVTLFRVTILKRL